MNKTIWPLFLPKQKRNTSNRKVPVDLIVTFLNTGGTLKLRFSCFDSEVVLASCLRADQKIDTEKRKRIGFAWHSLQGRREGKRIKFCDYWSLSNPPTPTAIFAPFSPYCLTCTKVLGSFDVLLKPFLTLFLSHHYSRSNYNSVQPRRTIWMDYKLKSFPMVSSTSFHTLFSTVKHKFHLLSCSLETFYFSFLPTNKIKTSEHIIQISLRSGPF